MSNLPADDRAEKAERALKYARERLADLERMRAAPANETESSHSYQLGYISEALRSVAGILS